MTSRQRIWMTPREYTQLQAELAELRARRSTGKDAQLTNEVAEVVGGHTRDPVAGPGMVLTIRYDATGEIETFLLGRRGAEDAGVKVYSMASPMGHAIAGARPGDQRIYSIPDERGVLVTLLAAVPYEAHDAERSHGRSA